MSYRREFPGDAIWERLARECGPISDVDRFDDAELAAAISERRVMRLYNLGDGYAGWYIWISLIDNPEVDLAELRQRRLDHLYLSRTVIFTRPLDIRDREIQVLENRLGVVSWDHFSEMPHLPT